MSYQLLNNLKNNLNSLIINNRLKYNTMYSFKEWLVIKIHTTKVFSSKWIKLCFIWKFYDKNPSVTFESFLFYNVLLRLIWGLTFKN